MEMRIYCQKCGDPVRIQLQRYVECVPHWSNTTNAYPVELFRDGFRCAACIGLAYLNAWAAYRHLDKVKPLPRRAPAGGEHVEQYMGWTVSRFGSTDYLAAPSRRVSEIGKVTHLDAQSQPEMRAKIWRWWHCLEVAR